MKLDRMQHLLDAYGADPARWPARERDAAEVLAAASPDAARLLDQARRVDSALDAFAVAPATQALHDAILRSARRVDPPRRPTWRELVGEFLPVRPLWPNLAGLAAAAILGIGIGLTDLGTGTALADETDAQTAHALFGDDILDDAL
jgi:hypothetical protein